MRDWSSDVCSSDLDNFLIRNHGHAVADGIQAVEIMGHHHDSKPQRVAQRPYQLVKFGGGDRVEARSGFVKEQQFWIERQGPRYAYTFSHSDRKSTRLNPVTNAHLVCRLLLYKKKTTI